MCKGTDLSVFSVDRRGVLSCEGTVGPRTALKSAFGADPEAWVPGRGNRGCGAGPNVVFAKSWTSGQLGRVLMRGSLHLSSDTQIHPLKGREPLRDSDLKDRCATGRLRKLLEFGCAARDK